MYKVIKQDNNIMYNIREYACDTPDDIENLPTNIEMGSICIVISTSEVYMLNSAKEWVKL